jgi:hypothetical protein
MTVSVISQLIFAIIAAMGAWRGWPSPWVVSGNLLMTTTSVIGATVFSSISQRRAREAELVLNNHQLLEFYDTCLRSYDSIKYWYGIPMGLGLGLVCYPTAVDVLGRTWGSLIVAGLLLTLWIVVFFIGDAVADLRRKREDLRELFDQAGPAKRA